jgi:hypothetical protein
MKVPSTFFLVHLFSNTYHEHSFWISFPAGLRALAGRWSSFRREPQHYPKCVFAVRGTRNACRNGCIPAPVAWYATVLFSAYLARFVEKDRFQVTRAFQSWSGAEPLLRTAWQQAIQKQPANGRKIPSSFGNCRRRSGRPKKETCRSLRRWML